MTPHFSDRELACHCGCGMLPQKAFMDKVEDLRVIWGAPLLVLSAARCPTYNARVSETGDGGPHTTGRAIDLHVDGKDAYAFLALIFSRAFTFTGVGIKQKGDKRVIHLDDLDDGLDQPRPRVWTY